MTHRPDYTLSTELLEQLTEGGLDALPEMIRIVINTAMQAERQQYLGVTAPYERSPQRLDQANGYKAKSVKTRVGEVTFSVPQVRQGDFYPQALEKGLRSERALTLALAEMYVQGSQRAKWPVLCGNTIHAQLRSGRLTLVVMNDTPEYIAAFHRTSFTAMLNRYWASLLNTLVRTRTVIVINSNYSA